MYSRVITNSMVNHLLQSTMYYIVMTLHDTIEVYYTGNIVCILMSVCGLRAMKQHTCALSSVRACCLKVLNSPN